MEASRTFSAVALDDWAQKRDFRISQKDTEAKTFAIILYTVQDLQDSNTLDALPINGALVYTLNDQKLFCTPYIHSKDGIFKPIAELYTRADGIFFSDYFNAQKLFDDSGTSSNIILIASTEKPIKRPRWIRRFLSDKTDSYLAKKAD